MHTSIHASSATPEDLVALRISKVQVGRKPNASAFQRCLDQHDGCPRWRWQTESDSAAGHEPQRPVTAGCGPAKWNSIP